MNGIYIKYEYDFEWFNPETNSYIPYHNNDIIRFINYDISTLFHFFKQYIHNITPKDCILTNYKIIDYWYG